MSAAPARPPLRRLIGTIALLVFLIVYALAVMMVAVTVLPQAGKWAEPVFYLVGGLLWIVPAGLLIRWMYRKP
jgi:hypothetical protein